MSVFNCFGSGLSCLFCVFFSRCSLIEPRAIGSVVSELNLVFKLVSVSIVGLIIDNNEHDKGKGA